MPTIEVRAFPYVLSTPHGNAEAQQYSGAIYVEPGEEVTLYDFSVLSPTQALINVVITREVADA